MTKVCIQSLFHVSETVSLDQLTEELSRLEVEAGKDILEAIDEEALEKLRVNFLGKKYVR